MLSNAMLLFLDILSIQSYTYSLCYKFAYNTIIRLITYTTQFIFTQKLWKLACGLKVHITLIQPMQFFYLPNYFADRKIVFKCVYVAPVLCLK